MRIAVLSDVHGAAAHLAAALAAARATGFDVLIVAGDLWTYGPEPCRTFDLVAEATAQDGAVLLRGNHDQIYLDARRGEFSYFDTLPGWIKESVEWTMRELEGRDLDSLEWEHDWRAESLLVAHANPFGPGDWRYLATPEQMEPAAEILAEQGFKWGVFGHTHRACRYDAKSGSSVITVGSLGQPRDRSDPTSQWTMLQLEQTSLDTTLHRVELDWDAHCRAIDASPLSPATKQRLKEFYLHD